MIKFYLFSVLTLTVNLCLFSQNVVINTTGNPADPSAMLDVQSNNKGLLIPRIALTGTSDNTTILSPATSLLIYNTATAGSGGTAVTPGYYYWNGGAWTKLATASGGSASGAWLVAGNSGINPATDFWEQRMTMTSCSKETMWDQAWSTPLSSIPHLDINLFFPIQPGATILQREWMHFVLIPRDLSTRLMDYNPCQATLRETIIQLVDLLRYLTTLRAIAMQRMEVKHFF